jgi:hypothetical protein
MLDKRSRSAAGEAPRRSGGSERTVFKLGLRVSKLELVLEYEGFSVIPHAQCRVSDYDMVVRVQPESMLVTAELGNAQVEDCALPEGSPYRQICGLRTDTTTSLISMQFQCVSTAIFAGVVATWSRRCVYVHRAPAGLRCMNRDASRDLVGR